MTDKDLTAISAYLDGELSARERARLEARLKTDPGLKARLKQLESGRTLMRSLPEIRAPRNFTLTPEMAGVHSGPPRLFPVLRFASALATILLVLFVAGDLLGALPGQPPAIALFAQPQAAELRPEATPLSIMEAPAAEPLAEPEVDKTAPESASEGALVKPEAPSIAVEAADAGQAESLEEAAEAERATPLEGAGPMTAQQLEGTEMSQSLSAASAPAEQLTAEAAQELQADAGAEAPGPGLKLYRLIELALAAFAIISGSLAVLLRRRSDA